MPLSSSSPEEIERERLSAAMIIRHWQPWFKALYGGKFPADYFGYDIESTGFSRKNDLIVEWGHVMVRGGEVVDRNSVIINWLHHPAVRADYVISQLQRVERAMRADGRSWHVTAERMEREGVSPEKVLPWIYDLMTAAQSQGMMMVGHNAWNFDNPMLRATFQQDLDKDFEFNPNQVFDTGCVEKASQLYVEHGAKALPKAGETLLAYFKRISGWRAAGVYHNLDKHCVKKYGLDKKYGIDAGQLHAAGDDAYVLHLLMQEFKLLCEACPVPAAVIATHALPQPPPPRRPLPGNDAPPTQAEINDAIRTNDVAIARAMVPAASQIVYRSQRNR